MNALAERSPAECLRPKMLVNPNATNSDQSDYLCSDCNSPLAKEDSFCPNCGSLFSDESVCSNHSSVQARGVCVICRKPYCSECGKKSNGLFVCNEHWFYEIVEGMARVFGTIDNLQAQFVTTCLEQAGLHPFLYSMKANPGAGMVDQWYKGTIRSIRSHPANELKVLVPFDEVTKAESTLRELNITETSF